MQRRSFLWALAAITALVFPPTLAPVPANELPKQLLSLGKYDPVYGYPAPQWFQELEVISMTSWGPLAGQLEFNHSAGGFQAARDGYYAAGPYSDAGLADLRTWNARGTRVSTYQDNLPYGIIEHKLGIEWVKENFRNKNVSLEWVLTNRWLPGQAGWPGKYVNKDGHEEEWNLYDKDGKWVWKWGLYPGRHLSCVNTKGVWNAWQVAVRSLMELGDDGIMFDNFSRNPEKCCGEDLGKHKHLFPDKSNTEVVGNLYREIFRIIKGYHPDRVMWTNSLAQAPWIWFDGQVIEGIFGHGDYEKRPSADVFSFAVEQARKHQAAVTHGKVLIYMPYVLPSAGEGLGVPGNDLDRLFFGYTAARLGRYVVALGRLRDSGKKEFYLGPLQWLRLKTSCGEMIEIEKAVHLRCYQRGVVVLNGTSSTQHIKLRLGSPELQATPRIVDVRTEKAYDVRPGDQSVEVQMPPWSGRVFATEQAFRLAQERKLPEKPQVWKAPLLPGREIAPADIVLTGPDAWLKWHREHPDAVQYDVAADLK